MAKPVGGRGKQSPYPSKVVRVPEALLPVLEEMIEHLYETGEILDNKTCNKFDSNQQEEIKKLIYAWADKWLSKAQSKEKQPRWENLVKAIKEIQLLVSHK